MAEIMDMLCMISDMMETPSRVWLGPVLTIVLGKPEDIQTVLLSPKCLDKPYTYRFLDDSNGLLTSPIHLWKPHRKLLNPTFSNKILLSFIPIFNAKSKTLVDVLGKQVDGKAFDVSKLMLACTLEMVCSTTIGVNLEFQSNQHIDFLEALEIQYELVANRMTKFWPHPQFIYKWTRDFKDYQKQTNIIYESLRKIRKMKEKEFYDSRLFEKNEKLKEDEFFSTPQIFVNELFKMNHKKLFDDDRTLDDHILAMLIGGHETSGLTSSHVILLLAMHQDIQEKVFQEIKNTHETQTSESDAEIIAKLDYLEMCIKETMRLYPIGPFLGRQNIEEIKLSNCIVPKGTNLVLSCHYLHRDKEVWGPNADMFNPDNFLPDNIAARHPYSYLPFSAGTRNCIGMKYGWMSMKIMLSAILRKFKFSTDLRLEDIVTKFEITLKLQNRHLVTVERRQEYL